MKSSRIYVNVSYAQKDEAKTKGAKWEPQYKKWYFITKRNIDEKTTEHMGYEIYRIPKPKELNLESLVLLVESIIANFKQLIEEKELWRMFWTQRGSDFRHVKELYSQMLFYMVCESWLMAQNSDVSLVYESKKEFGKQLVFRFSLAGKYEVIVLVKNSDNSSGLELFYEKQVKFSKKEGKSFYVVMNFRCCTKR